MRNLGPVVALALIVACGGGPGSSPPGKLGSTPPGGDGGTTTTEPSDAGVHVSDASAACPPTSQSCGNDCEGLPIAPECVNHTWVCPPGPLCPDSGVKVVDSGPFADVTVFEDAAEDTGNFPDAAPPPFDAEIPNTVECGGVLCNTQAFYCQEATAGSSTDSTCAFYPPACAADPTCACLSASLPGCTCQEQSGGGLVVQCSGPLPP
jgi:hypothetical protein